MAIDHRPIDIQGYDVDRSNLDALYDKNQRIFMSQYDLLAEDFLTLVDGSIPPDLNPTDEYYQMTEWDIYAGVQERIGEYEEYMNTGGILQNYVRTMVRQELYSQHYIPGGIVEAMQAGNFGPLENWLSEYTDKAGKEQAQAKTKTFWDIFNYGTLTAGSSFFNHSLPSGKIADASGNYIYDTKPLFAKSSGSEHPQSNLVTGTTFYNLTLSLAWSRANYETVRYHVRNTNNRDVFGRRFRNEFTHLFANENMQQYIEPDFLSGVKDGDNQVNIRQGDVIRKYTPWITDTDAWGVCDPTMLVKWIDQWKPMKIKIFEDPKTDITYCRVVTYFGWTIKDWHSAYWCNQAEA